MDNQTAPLSQADFLVFLFVLACGVVLMSWFWHGMYGTGPWCWVLALWRYARTVKHSQVRPAPAPHVMSREEGRTEPRTADGRTDGRTDERADGDPRDCPQLQLDRTRTALIEVLVYNDWGVAEIRAVVKGENAVISQEVDAARARISGPAPAPRVTPIAGRQTRAVFFDDDEDDAPPARSAYRETDPELAYSPPSN